MNGNFLSRSTDWLLCKLSSKYRRQRSKELHAEMFALKSPEKRFSFIHEHRLWSSKESISGTGSELETTLNIRDQLPKLFKKHKVLTLLDAPCGDFHWMNELLKNYSDIKYIGGDIVGKLIEANTTEYANKNISFQKLDITSDALPASDLMLVRDCLFHLSYEDIYNFLINFEQSEVGYLLTTTHKPSDSFHNRDIVSGDFRFIDLFSAPFNFPIDVSDRMDDYRQNSDIPRELCLFTREQVTLALKNSELLKK